MNIVKVNFLNDLDKTIEYLKSIISKNDEFIKIKFYKSGMTDDNNSYERSFYNIDDIDLDMEHYSKATKITMILKNNNIIKTIYCDKNNNMIVVTDNSKKNETKEFSNDIDISSIDMDDKCTYYKFEYGIIGKYDPDTNNYYSYEDGAWVTNSTIMRWVEDGAYSYEEIKKEKSIPRL